MYIGLLPANVSPGASSKTMAINITKGVSIIDTPYKKIMNGASIRIFTSPITIKEYRKV